LLVGALPDKNGIFIFCGHRNLYCRLVFGNAVDFTQAGDALGALFQC